MNDNKFINKYLLIKDLIGNFQFETNHSISNCNLYSRLIEAVAHSFRFQIFLLLHPELSLQMTL